MAPGINSGWNDNFCLNFWIINLFVSPRALPVAPALSWCWELFFYSWRVLVPSAGTRADSGSWFLPLDIWGQKSFGFRGSCSHNVPARNRNVSLLFKAGPDYLSASWCAKPSPGTEPAFFFLPNSQASIPLAVLQRGEQSLQLRQEFEVFLKLFWKESGG